MPNDQSEAMLDLRLNGDGAEPFVFGICEFFWCPGASNGSTLRFYRDIAFDLDSRSDFQKFLEARFPECSRSFRPAQFDRCKASLKIATDGDADG